MSLHDDISGLPPLRNVPKAPRDPDNDSVTSVESLLPPPAPYKKALIWLILSLILVTIGQLLVCCFYTGISGNAGYFYEHPNSWEFCLVYADQTIMRYDQKLLDGVPTDLASLGLMNCLYAWMALGACFRALYHYEWIPSTIAFTIFNAFGQLCYYQSTNLVIVPPKITTSLAAVTKWVSWDMYKNMGLFCFHIELHASLLGGAIPLIDTVVAEELQHPAPNCSDSVIILTDDISDLGVLDQITAMANSTVPNSDLNCDGAVWLHIAFLAMNYFFVLITMISLVVLVAGDRNIRRKHPVRHFLQASGEDLVGDRFAMLCVALASVGYFVTSVALCSASITSLDAVKDWELIDINTDVTKDDDQFELDLEAEVDFYVESWLPSKANVLNLQTVLLIVATMAVLRGSYKQSISAFRLAAVVSLLQCIIQFPPLVANYETFNVEHLWWWHDDQTCYDYFTGKPFYFPTESQSKSLCHDTRTAMGAALLQFAAMALNVLACCYVYATNLGRISLHMRFSQEAPCDFAGADLVVYGQLAEDDPHTSPLINAEYDQPGNTRI